MEGTPSELEFSSLCRVDYALLPDLCLRTWSSGVFTIYLGQFGDLGGVVDERYEVRQKAKAVNRRMGISAYAEPFEEPFRACLSGGIELLNTNIDEVIVGGHEELIHQVEKYCPVR